jgi:hypothetical protein
MTGSGFPNAHLLPITHVFGRGLEGAAGRADTDTHPLRDDLPRGAGGLWRGHLLGVHHNTRAPQLFIFRLGESQANPGLTAMIVDG